MKKPGAGQTDALQVIKELEQISGANLDHALYITKIYATLNDREMALSWLDRGPDAGVIGSFYKDEPVWDSIRSDEIFFGKAEIRKMGRSFRRHVG